MGFMDFFYNGVELNDKEPNPRGRRVKEQNSYEQQQEERKFYQSPQQREEAYDYPHITKVQSGAVASSPQSGGGIVVHSPQSYDEVQGIIDFLKSGSPILIDIQRLKDIAAQRVIDIVSGAVYALGGSIAKVQPSLFLLTPNGVDIKIPNL